MSPTKKIIGPATTPQGRFDLLMCECLFRVVAVFITEQDRDKVSTLNQAI